MAITDSQTFGKSLRLLCKQDFDQVFRKASKLGSANFFLLVRKNKQGYPRLGLAISKKNAKLAVSRNRIKRIVRESFRLHVNEIGGYDVIVLAKRGIDCLTKTELRKQIDQLWSRLAALP